MRNAHPTTNGVTTPIALMLIIVSQKNTLNRPSGKFGAFARGKENIANATKPIKRRVIRRTTRETLERNTTLQGGRRLNINNIN
jgi:hypothetical protein